MSEPIPTADEVAPTQVVAEAEPARIPLTISYFFVWMVTTAIWFKLLALILAFNKERSLGEMIVSPKDMIKAYSAMITLGALSATWMYVIQRFWNKSIRFPALAGHWICLLLPIVQLIGELVGYLMVYMLVVKKPDSFTDWYLSVPTIIEGLLSAAIWLIPVFFWKRPSYWRICFVALSILSVVIALSRCSQLYDINVRTPSPGSIVSIVLKYIHYAAFGIATISAIVCLILDFRQRAKLDWIHWFGVGGFFIIQGIEVVPELLFYFSPGMNRIAM